MALGSDADHLAELRRQVGTDYRIERELTGGGMSRVFVADEVSLGRSVVIKVLTPELAAGISLERFEREIRMVASLQQANIVPLLSAGRAGGLPFYTMPLVEGRSLRDRLERDGALPIRDAVNILRDVARALVYAHEHGVVHRDIKPDNILLSGDTAVVSDFGIAKALTAARDGAARLTQTGAGIGTPTYMAPEQAVGDPSTDHRADLYAFGCVAYEVCTGRPPFHGMRAHEVVAAHMQTVPTPVTTLRGDVPRSLADLVARCLAKDPSRRPQSARELLAILDGAWEETHSARRRTPLRTVAALASAAALMIAVGTFALRRARADAAATPATVSVAVLPFVNVGGDSAQEYLADGIRDEVTTALGRVGGVRIIGRSAAYQFRGRRDLDVRQVGRALGARYLLQGTLRQSGNQLRVSAQLSDSATGAELWSDTYDRTAAELAQVRDEIIRAIADTLHTRPIGIAKAHTGSGTASADAYDLYLRGEYLLQHRGSGVQRSVESFQRAIADDSAFARAYAGLSAALELLPYYTGVRPALVADRATHAATRALTLDSTLAEAHTSLALVHWHASRLTDAEREFRRGVEAEPGDFNSRFQYARFLISLCRPREALLQLDTARRIDPPSPLVSAWTAYALAMVGRHAQAMQEVDRALQIDSTMLPVVNFASLLYLGDGRHADARRVMSHASGGMTYLPYIEAVTRGTAAADAVVARVEHQDPVPWYVHVERGVVRQAVHDSAGALAALEQSNAETGGMWTTFIPVCDPLFDPLRSSARFRALLRAAHLDERVIASPTGGRG